MAKKTGSGPVEHQGEAKAILWSLIIVPSRGENVRSNLEDTEALAEDLKEKGQLQNIVVTLSGDAARPYLLVSGYNRMAAFELLGWTDREILATIKPELANDPIGRFAANYAENAKRVDVAPLDQAERLHQLVTGSYPVSEGETAAPVDKDEVCRRFGVTRNTLNKMIRVFENLDPDVAYKARKARVTVVGGAKKESARVPLRLFYTLSSIDGVESAKVTAEEDRAKKQHALLDRWIAAQEALAAEGRQRSVRSDSDKGGKGKGEGDDEPPKAAPVRPTKKIDKKKRTVVQYLRALEYKATAVMTDKSMTPTERKEAAARIEGATDAFRFMSGDAKRLSVLVEADFRAVEEAEEAEKEAERERKAAEKAAEKEAAE